MQQTTYYKLSQQEYGEAPDVALINGNMDVIDTALHRARTRTTDVYSEQASYKTGDFVIYQDTLYRCTADTSGVWDVSKWQATTIAQAFEPKRTWSLLKTITADGSATRYDETIPEGCIGLFIEIYATTAAANDTIQAYVSFSDASATWRRLGVATNGITTSARYTQFRYERDGENYWQGTQASPAAANQEMSLQVRQNGYIFTNAILEKLRINTDTNPFPTGSTITIYIKR